MTVSDIERNGRRRGWLGLQWKRVWGFILEPAPDDYSYPELTLTRERQTSWGWLPFLTLYSSLCTALVAFGLIAARFYLPSSELFFWVGILALYTVNFARLLQPGLSRRERMGIILVMGVSFYIAKIVHSPYDFTFYDELLHRRSELNMLATGRLFAPNSLLPVSPLYPGLELLTNAIVRLTGLDVFPSGLLVIGLARVLFLLVLFLFFEKISGSARLASIGAALYMSNQNFFFFDAQFSYESLAQTFTLVILFALEYRVSVTKRDTLGVTIWAITVLMVVVVTHHITTFFLIMVLSIWVIIEHVPYLWDADRPDFLNFLLLATVATMTWMAYIATVTINYLAQPISSTIVDLFKILLGQEQGRELFSTKNPTFEIPIFERIISYVAALIILTGIIWGVLWIWKHFRRQIPYVLMAIIALLYPVTQVLRFTSSGPELAARIGPFMFIGISFTMALGIIKLYPGIRRKVWWHIGITFLAFILFWSGTQFSAVRWAILPGPYLASADPRSIDEEGIAAARWTNTILGDGHVFAGDRTNDLLDLSYGNQKIVSTPYNDLDVPGIFISPQLSPAQSIGMCQIGLEFLVIDKRLLHNLPMLGFYFEPGEIGNAIYRKPFELGPMLKFNFDPRFNLIFNTGDIVIYQARIEKLCNG